MMKKYHFCDKELMKKMKSKKLDSRGQSLAEYAMILGLVATIAIVSLTSLASQLHSSFSNVASSLNGSGPILPAPAPKPPITAIP